MASRKTVAFASLCLVVACLGSAAPASAASLGVQNVGHLHGPGRQLWVQRYKAPPNGYTAANGMAVSPDGTTVFVAGSRMGWDGNADYATLAYDVASGSLKWAALYGDRTGGSAWVGDIGVSRDGSIVFVTGASTGTDSGRDIATVAYDAHTGSTLWVARYDDPAHGNDEGEAIGVGPDGATVFVTGNTHEFPADFVTLAYDASTGSQKWMSTYDGPAGSNDLPSAVGVSPNASMVFVTGASIGSNSEDYATVAYEASTGAQLWVARYDGPGQADDDAVAIGISPDGEKLYVTGTSQGSGSGVFGENTDVATLAYDVSTGSPLWLARYDGPRHGNDYGSGLAVSPDGTSVFATGSSCPSKVRYYDCNYATVAYTVTGSQLWAHQYDGSFHGGDSAQALGVSPDGSTVFVTGGSQGLPAGPVQDRLKRVRTDCVTVAYQAATGSQLWEARYDGPARSDDYGWALALSTDGTKVFVAGFSGGKSRSALATVAYIAT